MKLLMIAMIMMGAITSKAGTSPLNKPNFGVLVSLGLVPDVTLQRKYGLNPDIDSGTDEDVWYGGGDYPWPAAAAATTVVSDNAADDAAGTGCLTVLVTGLNSDFETVAQVATMDGVTPVALATNLIRIESAKCTSSGTAQSNVGTIDIKHGATIIGVMPPDEGTTLQCIYTVPAGHTWLIDTLTSGMMKKGSGTIVTHFEIKPFATQTWVSILQQGLDGAGSSTVNTVANGGRFFPVPAKTDVRVRGTDPDTTNIAVVCNIAGILVADAFISKAVY